MSHMDLGLQATYGHTEGTAGITGTLLAVQAMQRAASAPFQNLRNLNPYVTAALSDWDARAASGAFVPRQLATAAASQVNQPVEVLNDSSRSGLQQCLVLCHAFWRHECSDSQHDSARRFCPSQQGFEKDW